MLKYSKLLKSVSAILLSAAMIVAALPFAASFDGEFEASAASVPSLDMSNWSYNSSSNVYYQTGITYCSDPADSSYETLGVFVPAAYFSGTKNSSGTYTCTLNTSGTSGSYSESTAPIVIPVNTPGYSAMKPPTGLSNEASTYTGNGFIYLQAGCRGRDSGAPAGVTDLKAAIRFYRYYAAAGYLPGDTDNIYSFGHSGGGAQSAILGASGNSSLYDDYLDAIGAIDGVSDAVAGSMCWCPITNLDIADAAYEWNMGLTRSSLSSDDLAVSKGLAADFADYINSVGFKSGSTTLKLKETSDGYYQSGTYYDYMLGVVSDSLNDYLTATYGTSTSKKASYVSGLGSWASYDSSSDTATVTDLDAFASSQKSASKGLGAFDNITKKSQAENQLFGQSGSYSHFNSDLASLIKSNSTYKSYYSSFTSDLAATDSQGNSIAYRVNMYNPVYYLSGYYKGYGTSDVAEHWRIRTGITQGDTSLCTEADLALALENNSNVSDVDFATVWNQGHTEAEVSGNASTNFISWVKNCVSSSSGKSANPLTVSGKTATVKYSKLKKNAQKLAVSKVLSVSIAEDTTVRYAKVSGNKKIVINSSTGKVTVKKGLKKGTYKVKVMVTASGNSSYKSGSVTKTFKIVVK